MAKDNANTQEKEGRVFDEGQEKQLNDLFDDLGLDNAKKDDEITKTDKEIEDKDKDESSEEVVDETNKEDADDSKKAEGEEKEISEEAGGEEKDPEKDGKVVDDDSDSDSDTDTDASDKDKDKDKKADDDRIEALEKFIQDNLTIPDPITTPDSDTDVSTKPEEGAKQQEIAIEDFIGKHHIDDVVSNKDILNEILTKVVTHARNMHNQDMMRTMPSTVLKMVQHQIGIDKIVTTFYEENSDLVPLKGVVGKVATKLASDHPDWTMEKIFNESATETRNALKMPKPKDPSIRQLNSRSNKKSARTQQNKPGFAEVGGGKNRGKKVVQESGGIQSEINDMIK